MESSKYLPLALDRAWECIGCMEIHGREWGSRGRAGRPGRQCLDCVMDGTFPCHCHFISTKRVQSALSPLGPLPSAPEA